MARFTDELRQAGTGFLSPQPGVRDTSTAAAIEGFGNLAIEGYTSYKTGQLENEMEQLRQDFIDEPISYTPDEIMAMNDFSKRMDALGQMAKQRQRDDQFRVRAEALLKKHINTMPGLATEFRRAAAGVLGFDPTGEELRQRMNEVEQAGVDARQMLNQFDSDAQRSFGMMPGEVYTENGQEKYRTFAALRDRIIQNEFIMKLKQQQADAVQIDIPKMLLRNSSDYNAQSSLESQSILNNSLQAVGFTPQSIQDGLSIEEINKIPQEVRGEIEQQLKQRRQEVLNSFIEHRTSFDRVDDWNAFQEQIISPYDKAIAAIRGETALANFNNSVELTKAAVVNQMQGTKEYAQLQALDSLGLSGPPLANSILGQEVINLAGKWYDEKDTPTPEADQVTPGGLKAVASNIISNIDIAFGKDGTSAQRDKVTVAFKKMADMFNSGVNYKPDVLDAYVNVLKDPANIDKVKEMMSYSPEVADAITLSLRSHAGKAANGAVNSINRVVEDMTLDFVPGGYSFVRPTLTENGRLAVEVDMDEVDRYNSNERGRIPTTPQSPLMERVRRVNTQMLKRVNDTATAYSNLYGVSREEALRGILRGTQLGAQIFPSASPEASQTPSQPSTQSQQNSLGKAPEGTEDGIYEDANGNRVEVREGVMYGL